MENIPSCSSLTDVVAEGMPMMFIWHHVCHEFLRLFWLLFWWMLLHQRLWLVITTVLTLPLDCLLTSEGPAPIHVWL